MKFFTKTELRIFLIFWIIFSIFATSDRWNDNSTLDLTMAIVDEHRFEIDSYANNTSDRAHYNGHYYSDKVPGTAFFTVPLYSVYKIFIGEIPVHNVLDEDNISWKYQLFLFLVISLISAVCASLTIVLVYKTSKYFTSNEVHRNLVVIVLGLGTLLPHAGRQFNSHAVSTFFAFLCFYLIFKMKKEKVDLSFIAGIMGGLAILSEYRAIIVIIGVFIMVLNFRKREWILKFTTGVLLIYSILLLYNYSIYDSPFKDSTQHGDIIPFKEHIRTLSCFELIKHNTDQPTPLYVVQRLVSNKNTKQTVLRLLFYPFKGLIFYSPIIFFSFLGLFLMYKKNRVLSFIIAFCSSAYILHIASFSFVWWMGISFGPRHLTPLVPFLMIPLLYIFERVNNKVVLFFVVISILINIIGLQSVYLSHDPVVWSESYCEIMQSYKPIANPLFNNYMPSLFNEIPRNPQYFLVIEKVLGVKIIPIANILLLFFAFLLIWKNKIFFKN